MVVNAGVGGDGAQEMEGPAAGGHNDRDHPGLHDHQILPGRKHDADASDQAPNRKADHAPEDPDEHGSAKQAGSAVNGKDNVATLLARNDATQRTKRGLAVRGRQIRAGSRRCRSMAEHWQRVHAV